MESQPDVDGRLARLKSQGAVRRSTLNVAVRLILAPPPVRVATPTSCRSF